MTCLIGSVSALPVFPGAQGFGTETRAAYGGLNDPVICIVTDLTDNSDSINDETRNGVTVKTGSLRECIDFIPTTDTGKVIFFEVSGTINTISSPYRYAVYTPYTTIAGQTAPSPGITIRNAKLRVRTNDVLIQHLRLRVGDAVDGYLPEARDNLGITAGDGDIINNVVIDHLSMSWGVDETMEIYNGHKNGRITNITIAKSIISEGLDDSIHSDGPHSKGIHMSAGSGKTGPTNIAFLKNIVASHKDRTPKSANVKDIVIGNNLIYNSKWWNIFWVPDEAV